MTASIPHTPKQTDDQQPTVKKQYQAPKLESHDKLTHLTLSSAFAPPTDAGFALMS